MALSIPFTPSAQVRHRRSRPRPRRPKKVPFQPNRHDRSKLQLRIYKDRYGGHFVTDDEVGRDWVKAFLLCGFRTKQLKADAPWLTDDKLAVLRKEIRGLTFEDIGLVIHLTEAERTLYSAWRFFPWDVAPSERTKWLEDDRREQRRVASRKYYWKKRSEQAQRCKGDLRIDAILRMVDARPLSVPVLTKRARSPLFWPKRLGPKSMPDLNRKRARVHRELVRRAVKDAVALGLVTLTVQKRGRWSLSLVSKVPLAK